MDPRSAPIVLVLAFFLAGCVVTNSDQVQEQAPDETPVAGRTSDDDANAGDASESVPVEHPVSIDLVVPFYVYYSTVASDHCVSEVVRVDGPVVHVDVTATWDEIEPLVPGILELTVHAGTRGYVGTPGHGGHQKPLSTEEGPSPLTLDTKVKADDTVLLQICQWDNLAVAQDFDVHLAGSVRYLAPAPEGDPRDEPEPFEPETHNWDGVIPTSACAHSNAGVACVTKWPDPPPEVHDSNTFEVSEGASLASFEFTWDDSVELFVHVGGKPPIEEGRHSGTSPLQFEVPLDDAGRLAVSVDTAGFWVTVVGTAALETRLDEIAFHMELTVS